MANKRRDLDKEQYWREILDRQANSELSVRAFCREEKLVESAFFAWRKTIRERDRRGESTAPGFVPATVIKESQREAPITIELAEGITLRCAESVSAQRLAKLVQALRLGTTP